MLSEVAHIPVFGFLFCSFSNCFWLVELLNTVNKTVVIKDLLQISVPLPWCLTTFKHLVNQFKPKLKGCFAKLLESYLINFILEILSVTTDAFCSITGPSVWFFFIFAFSCFYSCFYLQIILRTVIKRYFLGPKSPPRYSQSLSVLWYNSVIKLVESKPYCCLPSIKNARCEPAIW